MGNGEVVARAREHRDKPEYVVSLYLQADYSHCPTTPLAPWFVELLQTRGGPYHTLAEEAPALNNPTTYAKVKQYHHHHERHVELKVDRQAIITKIKQEDDALQGIESHMEA